MRVWLAFPLLSFLKIISGQLLELTAEVSSDGKWEILGIRHTQLHKEVNEANPTHVESQQLHFDEYEATKTLLRIYGASETAIWSRFNLEISANVIARSSVVTDQQQSQIPIKSLQNLYKPLPPPPPLAITPLWVSGPSDNRIDLVFFADGYTLLEKQKFLQDAERLAKDISANQTFATVRPLLNIWAAFTPSEDSGITTADAPKNTTFGLYRVGTELRAIYCGKQPVARAACASLGTGCDYPILLANSPFYGGLGGEFSITTSSILNGALVLRHELGHSIIDVGEEYDGGYAYYGPNSSPSPPFPLPKWSHWLTNSSMASNGTLRVERAVSPLQAYPWTLLNKTVPHTSHFNSSGTYSSHMLRFSLSGIPRKSDLKILLDNEDVNWTPRPDLKMDRWHYDIPRDQALSAGPHNLTFRLGETAVEGQAQLCSLEIIEYGNSQEFNRAEGNIAAYPTFSMWNGTTLRPTNEGCLMRQVVLPHFCKPCTEGLWLQLFKRIQIIDQIEIISDVDSENVFIKATPLPIGQFRREESPKIESMAIQWSLNGTKISRYDNQTQFFMPRDQAVGFWELSAQFYTEEVKSDPRNYLNVSRAFSVD
ncbi:hypothetical protein CPB86DRAFT_756598 [Serendipita vermifera]|nr:hypothetical protein CPB86DRAFT_756598 [Serendipita vermifera]